MSEFEYTRTPTAKLTLTTMEVAADACLGAGRLSDSFANKEN